jgi:hypothetical protein
LASHVFDKSNKTACCKEIVANAIAALKLGLGGALGAPQSSSFAASGVLFARTREAHAGQTLGLTPPRNESGPSPPRGVPLRFPKHRFSVSDIFFLIF